MPASHQEKSERFAKDGTWRPWQSAWFAFPYRSRHLFVSLHGHADSRFAASKITAGHIDPQCKKVPPSSENTANPILCTLDSKRLVIEASGGRTVAVRADAVLFERRFDAKTEAA